MIMSRARAYCFTSNNYTDETLASWRGCGSKYLVIGKEVGESGTPHLQGYVEFATVKSLSQLKAIDGRAHFEVRKGTPQQAADYCKKDGDFEESGTITKTRDEVTKENADKWAAHLAAAKAGKFDELPGNLVLHNYRNLVAIRNENLVVPHMDTPLDNYFVWGETHVGKSHWLNNTFPNAYIKPKNEWWCGYMGEEDVIVEDVCPGDFRASWIKNWADKWAFPAAFKGGHFKRIRPKRFVMTSNYPLEELFPRKEIPAISRRFHVLKINNLGALPVGEFKIREELNIPPEVEENAD